MMRSTRWSLFPVVVTLLVVPVLCCAAPPRIDKTVRPSAAARVSPNALRTSLDKALQSHRIAAPARRQLAAGCEKLPAEVQQVATAVLDPGVAEIIGRPELTLKRDRIRDILSRWDPEKLVALLKPRLEEVGPAGGVTPGELGIVIGGNFTTDCEVLLDGTPATDSYYWVDTIMLFRMPATAALGSTRNVSVHDKSRELSSSSLPIKVVAPRGYRGVHGLSFANFGDPVIGWNVYSACFGQSNVEFSDGTHRPSAQAWYDGTYKTVGAAGNCFGMSQLALRLREFTHYGNTTALSRVMHGAWVGSTVTWGAWTLPWGTNSKEAVESLQGTQLVQPMATHIAYQRANQDNKSAWTYADNMLDTQSRPVQNTLYGHAVVTFDTASSGSTRTFFFYDNNHPYSETETGPLNPQQGTTNWNTGTFSYGGYTKTRCYDPHELTGQPLLPAGVGPADSAAEGSLVRFEVPRVEGIAVTDEAGRGGPDGTGVPGLAELTPDMGLGPIPETFPRIFLLQQAAGRTLSFTIPNAARQTRQVTCFTRGGMLQLELNGATMRASFSRLDGANAQVTLPDPAGSGLQQIRILAPVGQNEERQFLGDGFSGLGATALGMSLSPDRTAIELLNAPGAQAVQLRLQLQRFRPGGADARPAIQQTLTAGQLHRVGPQSWNAVSGQLLQEQLNLPANRLRMR